MASGIRVPFVAEVSEWLRGTRRIRDDLRDLEAPLEDLEAEAEAAGRALRDGLEDGADRAARSFRDLSRDADRELDKVRRDADRAGRDVADSFDELGEEAGQSAAEVSASFDGSVESIIEGFQEVAAQSSRIFGGIAGTIAGLAGGAVIGLVVSAFERWRDKQEEIQDGANDLFTTYLDIGGAIDANAVKQQEAAYLESLTVDQIEAMKRTIADVNRLAGTQVLTFQDLVDYSTGQKDELFSTVDLMGKLRDNGRLTTGETARLLARLREVTTTTQDFRAETDLARDKWNALRGEVERIPRSITVDLAYKERVLTSPSLPSYIRDAYTGGGRG